MRESDEKVKQKLAEENLKMKLCIRCECERHLKGTLSSALAHTQARYKDSAIHRVYLEGRLFRFQRPKVGTNKGEQLCPPQLNQPINQSINLWYKQNTNTKVYCHSDRKTTVHTIHILFYWINTAKDI